MQLRAYRPEVLFPEPVELGGWHKREIRTGIVSGFDLCFTASRNFPQHIFLESWMTSIAVLRNCCAHHARTWNRVFSIKPQLPSKLPNAWITGSVGSPSKLYPQLCCLQYLLNSIGVGVEFRKGLKALLAMYSNVDTDAMGFPKNWMSDPLWSN